MTASQSCKSVPRARRFSTGHGRARSDITLSSQVVRQSSAYAAARKSFESNFTVPKLAGPARSQSNTSPAAFKSP